jgi:hypothetical protein
VLLLPSKAGFLFSGLRPRLSRVDETFLYSLRPASLCLGRTLWPGLARWFFLKPSRVSCMTLVPGRATRSAAVGLGIASSSVFAALITGLYTLTC